MDLNFGIVKQYNREKGFGFLTHPSYLGPDNDIFFHISNVKRSNTDLANRLSFFEQRDEICFWYTSELTDKGEKLQWILTPLDVYNTYQNYLPNYIRKIKTIWMNTEPIIPFWLRDVTIGLLGLDIIDQLKSVREDFIHKPREDWEMQLKQKDSLREFWEEIIKIEQEGAIVKKKVEESLNRFRKIQAAKIKEKEEEVEEKKRAEERKRAEEIKRAEERKRVESEIPVNHLMEEKISLWVARILENRAKRQTEKRSEAEQAFDKLSEEELRKTVRKLLKKAEKSEQLKKEDEIKRKEEERSIAKKREEEEEKIKRQKKTEKQPENIQEREFELLVAEMKSKGFTKSSQVSYYIIEKELGYKYQNISGVLEMKNSNSTWKFNGGFPPMIYSMLCDRLNLGNNETDSKVIGFTSFKDINNNKA